jgi:phage terminase small subunit
VRAVRDAERGGLGLDWSKVPRDVEACADALGEWERLAAEYANAPTRFREGDRQSVTAYCLTLALYLEASRHLMGDGMVVDGRSAADRGRVVRSPWMTVWTQAGTALRHWARECALTVDSRGRTGLVDDGKREPDDSPFGDLLD